MPVNFPPPEPYPLWSADVPSELRDRVDGIHLEAVDAAVAAFTGNNLDVRRIVARSSDPRLLALVLAHVAGDVLRRTPHPEAALTVLVNRIDDATSERNEP